VRLEAFRGGAPRRSGGPCRRASAARRQADTDCAACRRPRARGAEILAAANFGVAPAGFLRNFCESRVRPVGHQRRLQAADAQARCGGSLRAAAHADAVHHHAKISSTADASQDLRQHPAEPGMGSGGAGGRVELPRCIRRQTQPQKRRRRDRLRLDACGGTKIYAATRSSVLGSWSAPVLLDSAVNIATSQTRPSISRDGQRLYFGSNAANQTGDTGADIFVSTRSGPGEGQDK
jgi:hypothetical protein